MENFLICPVCGFPIKKKENYFLCEKCKRQYPLEENIGILVKNFSEHQEMIKNKVESREDWFCSDQITSYEKGSYRHHLKKRIKFVEKILDSYKPLHDNDPNILDLGCGDGANLRWLSNYSKNLWGTDYNLFRLQKAQNAMNFLKIDVKLFLVDIFNIPFAENSFDVIFFNHVIEHLEDDLSALQNIYKITKKNGLVILGTPNEGALIWKFAYFLEPMIKKSTDHVHFYTSKSLSIVVRKAGFKIRHIEHIGWGIPIWRLDPILRKHKPFDDLFEFFGKKLFKKQATSLYLILEKS